jgi:hypothetical protein
VKWVQDQVGHSDSKMTLDVYAQLQQRAKREHGTRFDKLMQEGRASLYRNDAEPGKDPRRGFGTANGTESPKTALRPSFHANEATIQTAQMQGFPAAQTRHSDAEQQDFQSCALPTELSRR